MCAAVLHGFAHRATDRDRPGLPIAAPLVPAVVMCTARAVLVLDIADIKLAAPVVGFLAAAASVVWPYIVLTCEKGYAL
jgi:hypothetical protein